MGSNEYPYNLEVWHRRTKEMIREADKARLAKGLRARRRKSTSGAASGGALGFLVAALMVSTMVAGGGRVRESCGAGVGFVAVLMGTRTLYRRAAVGGGGAV